MKLFLLIWVILKTVNCNSPPVLRLNRNWQVPENEEVGTVIERVKSFDGEGDVVVYGIQPSDLLDGSEYFGINPRTGVVKLNKSLEGLATRQFYLYVSAYDGKLTSKSQVWVQILPPVSPGDDTGTNAPSRLPGILPGLITHQPPIPTFVHIINTPLPPPPTLPPATPSSTKATTVASFESSQGTEVPPLNAKSPTPDALNGFPVFLIPIITTLGMLPLLVFSIWFLKKKCSNSREKRPKTVEKKELSSNLSTSDVLTRESSMDGHINSLAMQQWSQRALSNKYESNISRPNSDDMWEFPRHHLRIHGIVGEGCFGQVWKCEALNIVNREGYTTVAVKTLKENATERDKKDLEGELRVLKTLDYHPNVVSLLGCCTEKEPTFVILEFVPNGKLQTYLRNSRADHPYSNLHGKSGHLTARDLTSFAYQVAKGMNYLSFKGIIHRDLAARNVLVGDDNVCKVADFGFARDVVASYVYERKSEGQLPIRWMAPESLYDNTFTTKSDVWSFGILMWEIVTLGSTPYPGMGAAEVMKKVRAGYRLEKPEHCKREIYNIMYYCWDDNPEERPPFSDLVTTLEALILTETDYIELDRFPEHSYYNIISHQTGEKL